MRTGSVERTGQSRHRPARPIWGMAHDMTWHKGLCHAFTFTMRLDVTYKSLTPRDENEQSFSFTYTGIYEQSGLSEIQRSYPYLVGVHSRIQQRYVIDSSLKQLPQLLYTTVCCFRPQCNSVHDNFDKTSPTLAILYSFHRARAL